MHKWKIRMEDGTAGLCWTGDEDSEGKKIPCPFEPGKMATFTIKEEPGKELKIRYYDVVDFDREERITRMASVNSAAALGADLLNFSEHAERIYDWVTNKQR
jgi:hypothetical protein